MAAPGAGVVLGIMLAAPAAASPAPPEDAPRVESGSSRSAEATLQAALDRVKTEPLKADLSYLASDACEGRGSGYPGELRATEYIAGVFRTIGLEPAGDGGGAGRGYFQTFPFHPDGPVRPWEVLTSRNVLGILEGADGSLRNEIIVLGAHHDGQGRAGQAQAGRLPAKADGADDDVWNSADDDASGVAVLLEVARVLRDPGLRPRRSIVFATFGAEEHGLNGSVEYVAHPPFGWRRHVAMINLEKLGRIPGGRPITASSGTSALWPEVTARANRRTGMSVTSLTPDIISDTDHYPFAARGLPAIVIGMAHEEDTHQPSDSEEKIAYDDLARRARFVLAMLLDLGNGREHPRFDTPPRRDPGLLCVTPTTEEMTTLGRGPAEGGLKVSAVIPGLTILRGRTQLTRRLRLPAR